MNIEQFCERLVCETFDDALLKEMEEAGIISQALGFKISLIAGYSIELEEFIKNEYRAT